MPESAFVEKDQRYNPACCLIGLRHHGKPYCSQMPDGAWVHGTRASLAYALDLLRSGEPERRERAMDVLHAVLALQDVDPTSATYGVWPWYLEEPLAQMRPADLNWADFCGAMLAEVLALPGPALPAATLQAVRVGLMHAAWSIFRRNVGPGYTNIAFMGACVTLAAGELLPDPLLLRYGRARLANLRRHAEHAGGFAEYNSPAYTLVAIEECDRILHLVRDQPARADAEALRDMLWTMIAEHVHPGTGEWAGPHSRVYHDRLTPSAVAYLQAMTGVRLRSGDRAAPDYQPPPAAAPCPPRLVERFRRLPETSVQIRRRFIRRPNDDESVYGVTWMNERACLGSVNYASTRDQRRPLLAYWSMPDQPAAVLRVRFLHDGYDFSSMLIRCAQDGPRVLAAFNGLTNLGDRAHQHDLPATPGVFNAVDWRVRIQLEAADASANKLDERRFELSAGPVRAVVHAAPGEFAGRAVRWECGTDDEGRAIVDAVAYAGPAVPFDLNQASIALAMGLELLEGSQQPTPEPVLQEISGGERLTRWAGELLIRQPLAGEVYTLV